LTVVLPQVLQLYKDFLVAASQKPTPEGRESIVNETRKRFKKNMTVPAREFGRIEHMIRMGEKKLTTVKLKSFQGIQTFTVR